MDHPRLNPRPDLTRRLRGSIYDPSPPRFLPHPRFPGRSIPALSGASGCELTLIETTSGNSFADLVFTGGHRRSLDAVLAGEVDAAVVDSIVLTSRRGVDPAMQTLRVVQRLGPWPVQPLVARADLPGLEIDRIRQLLLELNGDPIVLAALNDAALVRFVPTAPDHYSIVRHAMQRVH